MGSEKFKIQNLHMTDNYYLLDQDRQGLAS